jgi:hypothetical protein
LHRLGRPLGSSYERLKRPRARAPAILAIVKSADRWVKNWRTLLANSHFENPINSRQRARERPGLELWRT